MIWQMNLKNLMLDSYQFSVGLLTIMVKICIDTLKKIFFFKKACGCGEIDFLFFILFFWKFMKLDPIATVNVFVSSSTLQSSK